MSIQGPVQHNLHGLRTKVRRFAAWARTGEAQNRTKNMDPNLCDQYLEVRGEITDLKIWGLGQAWVGPKSQKDMHPKKVPFLVTFTRLFQILGPERHQAFLKDPKM